VIALLANEAVHGPPDTIFTPIWRALKDQSWAQAMGFAETDRHLGQYWFEAICFSLMASVILVLCAFVATRKYNRVPRGLQNILEAAVGFIRSLVHGFIGPAGDKYVPYLGTVFLFIFTMNLLGIVPAFRSPTMTLSTTAALGITTFVMIQGFAIRDVGLWTYLKHYAAGTVFPLALLMIVVEIIGELARPLSLSLRLYGNIFGEDNVIEKLMGLGGYIPVQMPMLALAIFTSFLQAFIFTSLATIYIATKVVHEHEEGHGEDEHEAESKAESKVH
jgi:F-type H+-transporting ATPase subunit a